MEKLGNIFIDCFSKFVENCLFIPLQAKGWFNDSYETADIQLSTFRRPQSMNNASVRAIFCCTYTIPKVLTFVVQAFKMNPFVRYHFKSWILLLDLQK